MLLGSMAEKEPYIRIPDLHPCAFRQMLMFLYTDRIALSEQLTTAEIWLAIRTMECARKYDIPELYFACRSFVFELIDEEHECGDCATVLIEAFGIKDLTVVDMAYYSILKYTCCPLSNIDLESVSLDLLCHLLERNETSLREVNLYNLCLRWAKAKSGENATPNKLKKVLGRARCLIRCAEMEPTEIADGPSEDKILSSDEVRLVYKKKFGSGTAEDYPFSGGERQLYQSRLLVGSKHQSRPTHRTVRFPVKVIAEKRTLTDGSFVIKFRPEMSLDICSMFLKLCELKYPFELFIDDYCIMQPLNFPHVSAEQETLAEDFLKVPAPPGPAFVVMGDVAVSVENGEVLQVYVAVRPGFKPTNWTVVGRVDREDELELLKSIRDMVKVNDDIYCELPVDMTVN